MSEAMSLTDRYEPDSRRLVPHLDPQLVASSPEVSVPTERGTFFMRAWQFADGSEHLSIRADHPELQEQRSLVPVAVRIHSECATGDIFGSFRCDCGPQLHQGLGMIDELGGFLIYTRQHEGRGIGLVNKLRAYQLQDEGLDTVDANLVQGLEADARDYRQVAIILRQLGLRSIRLISNNPAKAEALQQLGIEVAELMSDEIEPRQENQKYLTTKRERMNHLLTPPKENL